MAITYTGEKKPNIFKDKNNTSATVLFGVLVYYSMFLLPLTAIGISLSILFYSGLNCMGWGVTCIELSPVLKPIIVILPLLGIFFSYRIGVTRAKLGKIEAIAIAILSCFLVPLFYYIIPIAIFYVIILVLYLAERRME